jgi:hypothetical protein
MLRMLADGLGSSSRIRASSSNDGVWRLGSQATEVSQCLDLPDALARAVEDQEEVTVITDFGALGDDMESLLDVGVAERPGNVETEVFTHHFLFLETC